MRTDAEHQTWVTRLDYALEYRNIRKAYALAVALGVDQSAISRWRKRCSISIENAVSLCNFLDISLDWLLTGRGEIESHKPAVELETVLTRRLFPNLPEPKATKAAKALMTLVHTLHDDANLAQDATL